MKTNENVIYRCIADEHILIPVGSEAMDTNGLFVLTETGAIVWEKLCEEKSVDEIVAAICEEYDAPASSKVYVDLYSDLFLYHKVASCDKTDTKGATGVTLEYAKDWGYTRCPYCNPASGIE